MVGTAVGSGTVLTAQSSALIFIHLTTATELNSQFSSCSILSDLTLAFYRPQLLMPVNNRSKGARSGFRGREEAGVVGARGGRGVRKGKGGVRLGRVQPMHSRLTKV